MALTLEGQTDIVVHVRMAVRVIGKADDDDMSMMSDHSDIASLAINFDNDTAPQLRSLASRNAPNLSSHQEEEEEEEEDEGNYAAPTVQNDGLYGSQKRGDPKAASGPSTPGGAPTKDSSSSQSPPPREPESRSGANPATTASSSSSAAPSPAPAPLAEFTPVSLSSKDPGRKKKMTPAAVEQRAEVATLQRQVQQREDELRQLRAQLERQEAQAKAQLLAVRTELGVAQGELKRYPSLAVSCRLAYKLMMSLFFCHPP